MLAPTEALVPVVLLHPLDTIKSRLQTGTYAIPVTSPDPLSSLTADGAPPQHLWSGLYTGLGANVMKEAPDAAVFLALSEAMSSSLTTMNPWFSTHLTVT